jgi:hypothetical protein
LVYDEAVKGQPKCRSKLYLLLLLASLFTLLLAGCGSSAIAPTLAPTTEPDATGSALALTSTGEPVPTTITAPATTAAPTTPQVSPTPSATSTPEPPTSSPLPTLAPPTLTPTTAPSATATRMPAPTPAAGPQVLFFHVAPTTTVNLGDSLSMTWQASGQKAEICPISGPGPVESRCRSVALAGSTQFVTDEAAMAYTGFGLRVTAGGSYTWSLVTVHLQCRNVRPWYFDNPPERCPAAVADESYAAGQYFEHGLMIWVEDADDFHVFYQGKDEQGFQTFDWISDIRLKPGASPDNRLGQTPPPGLQEPVSGFGMVWRGEIEDVRSDVRQRLGWATEAEFGFTTAYQCVIPTYPRMWSCFLRGPQGEIFYLRPDSTAQVRFLWDEW